MSKLIGKDGSGQSIISDDVSRISSGDRVTIIDDNGGKKTGTMVGTVAVADSK